MVKLDKIFRKFQIGINNLMALILIIMMFVILAQTFFRFVIFKSLPWSEELSRYLFVVMIMLGINLGVSKDIMVRIDIIDKKLSEKHLLKLNILREIIGFLVSGLFFYSTFEMIKVGAFQKSPALQIKMSIMYIVIAFGFLLTMIATIFRIYELIDTRRIVENE